MHSLASSGIKTMKSNSGRLHRMCLGDNMSLGTETHSLKESSDTQHTREGKVLKAKSLHKTRNSSNLHNAERGG